MLRLVDLRGDRRLEGADRLPRAASETVEAARTAVAEILADVRSEGDDAIRRLTERLDGWAGGPLEVPASEAKAALDQLDPSLRAALDRALTEGRRDPACTVAQELFEYFPDLRDKHCSWQGRESREERS